ncbi:MAG: hypothetical protein ACE365_07020 [Gammaproteobacteria bacterium]
MDEWSYFFSCRHCEEDLHSKSDEAIHFSEGCGLLRPSRARNDDAYVGWTSADLDDDIKDNKEKG